VSDIPNPELCQTVWLTFDDGTRAGFHGKAVVFPGKDEEKRVHRIEFTPPAPLPPGCSFEVVDQSNPDQGGKA
jgi:hypothetical protein